MRGITGWGSYLPFRRLDRSQIAQIAGKGGGKGTRTVASFDEDPTTMAFEAARRALAGVNSAPDTLLFASVLPAYADKTNALAIHAALRLADSAGAFDLGCSVRSAMAGLLLAARGQGTTLVTAADIRTGLAGSIDEAAGGDGAAAVVFGDGGAESPVLAEVVRCASRSAEFVDRWRSPGDPHSKSWDDKFAEVTYRPLAVEAFADALAQSTSGPNGSDGGATPPLTAIAVSAPTSRIATSITRSLDLSPSTRVIDDGAATIGNCGAAQPGLMLAALLESSSPGDLVALVSVSDGADVLVLRVTEAIADHRRSEGLDGDETGRKAASDLRAPTVAAQAAAGAPISYGRYLAWRGILEVDPPRRPDPQRVSASAAARSDEWKFGFVASADPETGSVHLPPQRVSADGARTDEMIDRPMADAQGTIVTFTVDRVAYSPSPPIIFAVVDFDGGGRLPVEICDCDEDEVTIGARVDMTFRRLFVADGIPNYFWKARLLR